MNLKKRVKVLYPINITIFSVFSTALAILVGIIIIINYLSNAKMAYETADLLMEKNSTQVFMKIENLYEPLLNITNQSTALPILGEKPTLQNHPAESFLLNSMDAYPQIQILYMGYDDGDFYEILSCKGDLSEILRSTVNAPPDTEFAILRQFYVEGEDKPVRIWKYLNSMRQTIGSSKEDFTGYDPRERPWYINALATDGSVKTDPYYFTNVKQMGLTISHQIDGNVPGVIGADILMDKMTAFLDEIKGSPQEEILIFNKDLNIISNPSGIVKMVDFSSEIVKKFNNYIEEYGFEDEMNFTLDGSLERFLIKVKKLPNKYSNNEYLFIAVPEAEIMGSIVKNTTKVTIISIFLMILFLPIIMLLARQISAPINRLVVEANKIANFDLQHDIDIHSRIKETSKLTNEMASMKRGIRLFNKYVPSQLVRKLMLSGEDAEIGGTSKQMTFLFSDISNFTSITEKSDPQDLMKKLSEYFDLLSTIIREKSGTVDKFIGDAVMAFWNAPLEDIHHIENACISALEIQEELCILHEKRVLEGLEPFYTRIGINTGEAVVGNMGSRDRMNYTAIGDVVNSSSRLEGINKNYGTQIIIGQKVAEGLSSKYIYRPLENIIVKGKTESETIYELIGTDNSVSNGIQKFSVNFTKGFNLFYSKKWSEAEVYFHKAGLYKANDLQLLAYQKMCKSYIANPPQESWDGILKMKVK